MEDPQGRLDGLHRAVTSNPLSNIYHNRYRAGFAAAMRIVEDILGTGGDVSAPLALLDRVHQLAVSKDALSNLYDSRYRAGFHEAMRLVAVLATVDQR